MTLPPLEVRRYGGDGPRVVVLHGGPGAPGSAADLARGLASEFDVLEPLQRRSGDGVPLLTVARHVADLDEVVRIHGQGTPVPLVGSSWGAMLALAYAAAHPRRVARIALVGCGTFDRRSRARLETLIEARMTRELRHTLVGLRHEIEDPDEHLAAMGRLIDPLYAVDHLESDDDAEPCDARGHGETWEDMIRLQQDGTYPAVFAAIWRPVLMLHGDFDPHPGPMIRDSLQSVMPQLRFVELQRCGHYPWRERGARERFFEVLRPWLLEG